MSSIGVNHRYLVRNMTVPAAAWTPASLPDLRAWWKADAGVTDAGGGAVSAWADQSGNGATLTAAGTAQPTTAVDTINGLNVIKFDGSTDTMIATITGTVQPCTILAVAKNTVASGAQHELGIFNARDGRVFMSNAGNVAMFAGSSVIESGTAWGTTNAHQTVTVLNGASSALYVDGGSATTGNPGSEPLASDTSFVVGSYYNQAAEFWQGDIAEIVVMGSAIIAGDRTNWNTYCARWGL